MEDSKSVTIPMQNFDSRTMTVHEYEQVTQARIELHMLEDQSIQTIKTLAHICRTTIQKDFRRFIQSKQAHAKTVILTPEGASIF